MLADRGEQYTIHMTPGLGVKQNLRAAKFELKLDRLTQKVTLSFLF